VTAYGPNQTGTYELRTSVPDDFGDTASDAASLEIGGSVAGNLESGGDRDMFRFRAEAGRTYNFRTVLGSLRDSVLTIYAADGSTVLAINDDANGSLASQLEWTAPSSGTLYIAVTAYGLNQTGTYELQASIPPSVRPGPILRPRAVDAVLGEARTDEVGDRV
jgi:hypothetical protein